MHETMLEPIPSSLFPPLTIQVHTNHPLHIVLPGGLEVFPELLVLQLRVLHALLEHDLDPRFPLPFIPLLALKLRWQLTANSYIKWHGLWL